MYSNNFENLLNLLVCNHTVDIAAKAIPANNTPTIKPRKQGLYIDGEIFEQNCLKANDTCK